MVRRMIAAPEAPFARKLTMLWFDSRIGLAELLQVPAIHFH
jgi:hypothetical protein